MLALTTPDRATQRRFDDVSPNRLGKALARAGGRRVEITVDFNGLKSACDVLLQEGWRVMRIDLLKDRPACSISATKSG